MYGPKARFGLGGSIASKEDCDAAGGTFKPVIFNWMVHVYPYEKTMDAIWSVERQMPKGHDMNNMQGLEMKKDTEL